MFIEYCLPASAFGSPRTTEPDRYNFYFGLTFTSLIKCVHTHRETNTYTGEKEDERESEREREIPWGIWCGWEPIRDHYSTDHSKEALAQRLIQHELI